MSCFYCGKHECYAGRFCGSKPNDVNLKPKPASEMPLVKPITCACCGGSGPDFAWLGLKNVCFDCVHSDRYKEQLEQQTNTND